MPALIKNWDHHVLDLEEVARCAGFRDLRDRIIELAEPCPYDVVVDLGAGTGLLTVPMAEQTSAVRAIDISPAMCDHLRNTAASTGLDNITTIVGSVVRLPLTDHSADVVVSNYCFHHLSKRDKERTMREIYRVLRPGGRLVFADMMFRVSLVNARDRQVVRTKVLAMLHRGPAGLLRLVKNGARFVAGRWEQPARADWWAKTLVQAGFDNVEVQVLEHEGGLAVARRP